MSGTMSDGEEFVECDTCRAKPGSPYLCEACLIRRTNHSLRGNVKGAGGEMSTVGFWVTSELRKPVRKKRSATSETASVTAPLLSALNAIPGVHFTRINSGGYRGRSMGAPEGTPDLMGTVKGKAAVIETKAPGGKLSKAQKEWYQAYGHLYLYGIATSVADGVELVKGWMR